MILEHALLHVRPGEEAAFEAAMAEARPLIAASPGFWASRCGQRRKRQGFICSSSSGTISPAIATGFTHVGTPCPLARYLHHFYEPMPEVRYFSAPLSRLNRETDARTLESHPRRLLQSRFPLGAGGVRPVVLMIDVMLAGDNAIVVGALAAGLPAEQRRKVILIGILAAGAAHHLRAGGDAAVAGGGPRLCWRHIAAGGGVEDAARAAP